MSTLTLMQNALRAAWGETQIEMDRYESEGEESVARTYLTNNRAVVDTALWAMGDDAFPEHRVDLLRARIELMVQYVDSTTASEEDGGDMLAATLTLAAAAAEWMELAEIE